MKPITLTRTEAGSLIGLATAGLLIPNLVFIVTFLTQPEAVADALTNPASAVFVAEAFLLMFIFAWMLVKAGFGGRAALGFVIASLAGSMAFSVPAAIYLILRGKARVSRNDQ